MLLVAESMATAEVQIFPTPSADLSGVRIRTVVTFDGFTAGESR
jgi:hypothetical protein